MATDLYVHPDYYNMDDLLTEEHKMIRDAARAWVKKEVSPIIDEHYEKATFPMHLLSGLGEIGAFGPYIPEEDGGPLAVFLASHGSDYITGMTFMLNGGKMMP